MLSIFFTSLGKLLKQCIPFMLTSVFCPKGPGRCLCCFTVLAPNMSLGTLFVVVAATLPFVLC